MSAKPDSVKSILYALGANGAIAIAKYGAAWHTGSASMLAEAIHSTADCGNQGLLLWGLRDAKRPASPDYPLGHGKAIFFWSFVVALVLFSLGGLFSIYEGWHKLTATEPLTSPWLAVGILAFGVVVECISLWGCLREINKVRGGRTLWRWFRESRHSELVVVLGEDIAALLGLSLALAAVLMAIATGDVRWDAAGSIAIGVVLVAVAIGIGVEVHGLLIGQSADPQEVQAMRDFLAARPELQKIYRLLTIQLGSSVMVSVKAKVAAGTAQELITRINAIERDMRAAFPDIQWLFFEADDQD